jgi:IclR family transcriptional regulator, pca regulon regulatory protein
MSPRRTDPSQTGNEGEWVPRFSEGRYSHSLERGLAVLRCFSADRSVQGIADIADQLGMSRSTTHRYVVTLVALGYMEQVASRKYRLALGVTDLGMGAFSSTGLREHAHAFLVELRKHTSFTANLAVLDGPEIVYVDCVRSPRRSQYKIDQDLREGSRLPAYCTALGKMLLAELSESERREIISEIVLTRRGPNTITSKKALIEELDHVAEDGIATDNEELVEGLIAVAVPVRNASGEVAAAVSLDAHTSTIDLEQLAQQLRPHLLTTADHISARLGYRRNEAAR